MPSLIEKLKALGFPTGTQELYETTFSKPVSLDAVLGGSPINTFLGETYVVERRYPVGTTYGHSALELISPLQIVGEWSGVSKLSEIPVESICFLDAETTGLSGGTGTYAFLIGAGRFEENEFRLAQFFLRDPIEEPAQLTALENFLAPCQVLVTFNGKSFDVPLLHTRYITQGWKPILADLSHIDLLHLSRKLWRERLPSRTLSNLELQILGLTRTEEDIPGWMIPGLYFDYLHDGDAQPLKNVFYHNAMDVISLALLLNYIAGLLSDPIKLGGRYGIDLISLAKLFEDLGNPNFALQLYSHGLNHEDMLNEALPLTTILNALYRSASLHKRQKNFQLAIQTWEQIATHQSLQAHVELAKCYEHQLKDILTAIKWTEMAIELVEGNDQAESFSLNLHSFDRGKWLEELHRRQSRLQKKFSKANEDPDAC